MRIRFQETELADHFSELFAEETNVIFHPSIDRRRLSIESSEDQIFYFVEDLELLAQITSGFSVLFTLLFFFFCQSGYLFCDCLLIHILGG